MSGERTEKPTPKRKRDARREGRIARSPELVSWASLLIASIVAGKTIPRLGDVLRELSNRVEAAAGHPDTATAIHLLGWGASSAMLALAPMLLALTATGVVGNLVQVGFAPTTHPLKPKFSRINPIAGAKRLFGPASLWEAAKGALKVAIIGVLAWRNLKDVIPALTGATGTPIDAAVTLTGKSIARLVRDAAAVGLLLAAVDYLLQRRRTNKQLRMTKQEVKEEHRQSEGDPRLRGALREKQMRMSRLRMMAEVATADVVVVNPIHFAVALRYEASRGAPRVVAKGAGDVALGIREEAERHGVAVVEDVPLARTLHRACEIGDEIPAELYEAVARILAFIWALRPPSALRSATPVPIGLP